VKKAMLMGLGVILGLTVLFFILIKLAFGPLHKSVIINLGGEGKILCQETYNGDLAGEFYDVEMSLQTVDQEKYKIGSVTFYNDKWSEQIEVNRIGDWRLFRLKWEILLK
jgi:hypothetical protein